MDFAGLKHFTKFEESGVCFRCCCWPLGDLTLGTLSPSVFAAP